jgi:DNA mismatch repair protein MutS
MNEAANILNNATKHSLLLFDELGRGTSTFDGLSIAWAIIEHIHETLPGARTLFATHYHELNALAERYPRVHNLKVEVREAEGKVHFLHKIAPGFADHSYGIEVAAMAGIPPDVIDRAREILRSLEETELQVAEANIQREIPFVERITPEERDAKLKKAFGDERVDAVAAELRQLDLEKMTPIAAMNKIAEWKNRI